MVLAAEGRKANDSHADCYQYFCVPEYGTANGRLHFHAVHFMRTLPTGSVDPNFGRRVRNRRQLNSLQNTWPYFFKAEDGIRYLTVTGVQTCAFPIWLHVEQDPRGAGMPPKDPRKKHPLAPADIDHGPGRGEVVGLGDLVGHRLGR